MPEAADVLSNSQGDGHLAVQSPCVFEGPVLTGFAEDLTVRISRLRHSWLKNQLCDRTSDDVARLWNRGVWSALERSFDLRLDEVRGIAENVEDGFSPRQLVGQLTVFQSVPATFRADLESLVHELYKARMPLQRLSQALLQRTSELRESLATMRCVWALSRDDEGAEQAVRTAWTDLRRSAAELRRALGALPRGIVLP